MRITQCPFAAIILLLVLYPAAAAQKSNLRGTFTLDRQASDDVGTLVTAPRVREGRGGRSVLQYVMVGRAISKWP